MTAPGGAPGPGTAPGHRGGRRAATLLGWALAAVVASGWLTLVEVFWLPLRMGTVPLPVSVLAAVVGNPVLVTLAHRFSGSRLVGVLPAVVWLVVVLGASIQRPEGDLLIVGGGTAGAVNLAFLGLGVVSAAAAVGRLLGRASAVRRTAQRGDQPDR